MPALVLQPLLEPIYDPDRSQFSFDPVSWCEMGKLEHTIKLDVVELSTQPKKEPQSSVKVSVEDEVHHDEPRSMLMILKVFLRLRRSGSLDDGLSMYSTKQL